MHVLHLFKTYLPDSFTGIERVIWSIAEGTTLLGVNNQVLTLSANPHPYPVEVDHHVVHQSKQDFYLASTGISLSVVRRFRQLAADAEIIHYHFPWPMMDLLHLLVAPSKPTILTYHSDVVRQKFLLKAYSPLMHRFLQSVDRIISTSPNYLASSSVLRRYAQKVSIIPIGIPEEDGSQTPNLNELRKRVGQGFFLFVGALRYYKGLPFLMEAAKRTGLPIVIVGAGELRATIERAGLANVTLIDNASDADKAALLSLCRALVFPSHLRSEAFGVALLEAARAGRPMISCEIGTGTSFVNVDGETGITVPPADPEALAAAMLQMLHQPSRTLEMGRNARARYETHFRVTQMAESYRDEYRKLLSGA